MAVQLLREGVELGTGEREHGQVAAAGGGAGHHGSAERLQVAGDGFVQGLPVRHPEGTAQVYVWHRASRLRGAFLLQAGQYIVQQPLLHVQGRLQIADVDLGAGAQQDVGVPGDGCGRVAGDFHVLERGGFLGAVLWKSAITWTRWHLRWLLENRLQLIRHLARGFMGGEDEFKPFSLFEEVGDFRLQGAFFLLQLVRLLQRDRQATSSALANTQTAAGDK